MLRGTWISCSRRRSDRQSDPQDFQKNDNSSVVFRAATGSPASSATLSHCDPQSLGIGEPGVDALKHGRVETNSMLSRGSPPCLDTPCLPVSLSESAATNTACVACPSSRLTLCGGLAACSKRYKLKSWTRGFGRHHEAMRPWSVP